MHWADYTKTEKQDTVGPLIPDWKGPHPPPVITGLNRSLELNELCKSIQLLRLPENIKN